MKVCTKCKAERDLESFAWKDRGRGVRSSHCKPCQRIAVQAHYRDNYTYYKEKNKRRERELREFVDSQKERPCLDCGNQFPSRAMDFHHRCGDDNKLDNVSQLWRMGSRRRIEEEIAKCDLLCAVCHRLRH